MCMCTYVAVRTIRKGIKFCIHIFMLDISSNYSSNFILTIGCLSLQSAIINLASKVYNCGLNFVSYLNDIVNTYTYLNMLKMC